MSQILPPRRNIKQYVSDSQETTSLRLLSNNYRKWNDIAKEATYERTVHYHGNFSASIAEELYKFAMKITTEENLYDLDNQEIMKVVSETPANMREWAGIYLTALVNNACIDELEINIKGLSFIGYRLGRGLIRINADSSKYTGTFASNGIIENNAEINGTLLEYATGGIGFNNNSVLSLANFASDVIAINNGKVSMHMGYKSSGKLFVNNGMADNMGHSAFEDGLYLNNGHLVGLCNFGSGIIAVNDGTIFSFMGANALKGIYLAKKLPTKNFMTNAHYDARCLGSRSIAERQNLVQIIKSINKKTAEFKMPITPIEAEEKVKEIGKMIQYIKKASNDFNSPQDLNISK